MASRALNYWRTVASGMGARRGIATATVPKMKPYAPTADFTQQHQPSKHRTAIKGDFIPVYVALGMIVFSLSLGAHTAKQQLVHSPSVRVSKKKREIVPEVDEPDRVANESERFINKSLFRKVAHVQDFDTVRSGMPDPTRPDPFRHPRTVESLKSVGVDPHPR